MKADPRDLSRVVPLKRDTTDVDVDPSVLFALMSAMIAFLWKSQFVAWASFFFSISAWIRLKKSTVDYKQLFTTSCAACIAVVSAYNAPRPA